MKKDEVLRALMFYSPQAKWEIKKDADPLNVNYSDIDWNDDFYTIPSEEILSSLIDQAKRADQSNTNYQVKRREAYPTVEEQLDYIFHNGVDEWKARIQSIKDKYPKA
jgi:hypothetical protein